MNSVQDALAVVAVDFDSLSRTARRKLSRTRNGGVEWVSGSAR